MKYILVCPACGSAYREARSLRNLFGIAPHGFKCAGCGFSGAGPVKIREDRLADFMGKVGGKK